MLSIAWMLVLLMPLLMRCRQEQSVAGSEPPPIEIKATVVPAQTMTIVAQIDGQAQSVAVREGSPVTANGLIVQLTNPVVERDAAYAHAQLDWIEARRNRGRRAPVVAKSIPRSGLEITAKILELRQHRLEKMKELRRTNDVTARELEVAEIEYLAALRDYDQQRGAFAGGPAAAPADDSVLLRIEGEKTAAEVKFAEQRRSLLQITSPIAGTVTRVHVIPGQAVFPRDVIAEVSDVANLQVRGNLAPELLRYVKPGMRVEVKIFSVPPRTFADEVDYVIPVQGTGSDSRAAMIVVSIPNPEGAVQPNTEALITVRSLR